MKLREWLESKSKGQNVTFIISKVVEDKNTHGYHEEYLTTSIRSAWEWLEGEIPDKYVVLCKDHTPIDITGVWNNWYKSGRLDCAVVTTEEDVLKKYGENQGRERLRIYDEVAREKGSN